MTKFNCLIVDDEPVAQRIIESYLTHFPEHILVAKCKDAFEAHEVLIEKSIDLMFLDLEMPQIKGLSFLRTLRKTPSVIVTTAHREFAVESFDLEVLDYLLKPISLERFVRAMNRFKSHFLLKQRDQESPPSHKYIFLTCDRKSVKVVFSDIEYIEGMSNYIKIKLVDKSMLVYGTLSGILEKLDQRFLQIHRSFIINRDHLRAFSKEHVEINDKKIPVGKSFKKLINLIEE